MAKKQLPNNRSLEEAVALLHDRYDGQLKPPLEGLAYCFTIWLPVLARGQVVFTEPQRLLLTNVFYDCFGGCSQTTVEGFPPWTGAWLPAGGDEPIVDHHIQFVLYTLQDAEELTCLRQLKWILQQKEVAAQEVVLVEQVPVHLVEAAEIA